MKKTSKNNKIKKKLLHADGPPEPHWRQLAFYDPHRHNPKVLVIGAGGIGSNLIPQLTKLGVRDITVYDHDRVAVHNISTTFFNKKHVGMLKVKALREVVKGMGGPSIKTVSKKFTGQESLKGFDIVVSATDNLEARRILFQSAVKQKIPFLIDGRIGGENVRVYAIRPTDKEDREMYKDTVRKDLTIAPLPCTAQQVCDVGWTTSSLMVRALRQWVAEGKYAQEVMLDQREMSVMASPFKSRIKQKVAPVQTPATAEIVDDSIPTVKFKVLEGATQPEPEGASETLENSEHVEQPQEAAGPVI